MFDYAKFYQKNPSGVLATIEGNNVKTRVFQYLFAEGTKIYFCTSSGKEVFKQLQANPHASFCSYGEGFSQVVSVSGTTTFLDCPQLKKRALDENPHIANIYKSPENPLFRIFYLKVESVDTFSFSEGTKRYTLK